MPAGPAPLPRIEAAAGWRAVDFISDLHLHAGDAATAASWRAYLSATPADALFILGDLFEAWPGDDAAEVPGFDADCADALRAVSTRIPIYFLHGNRDFMVGQALAERTGMTLMADPALLVFGEQRVLLSHGDALCLADTDYLRFRAQVRAPGWVEALMARPLAERQALARQLRAESESRHATGLPYADADDPLARQWLQDAGARTLVHGHTHRPGRHELGDGLTRLVLSDWDLRTQPPRAEALRLDRAGIFQRIPLAISGA